MPVKRRASPLNARQVWIAIRHLSQTKQSSDKLKICKFLQKEFKHTLDESEYILKLLLEDNLLIISTNSNSRSKKINGYQTYKIPLLSDNDNIPNDYDWYCYDCHLGGDVIECKSCLRVFHENCSAQSMTKQMVNIDTQNINNNVVNDVQANVQPTLNEFAEQDLSQPLQPIQFEENVNNILISNENQRNITTDSLNNDCKLFDKNSLINSNTNIDNKDDEPDELKNIINIDEAKDNLLNANNIEFKKEERFSTDGFIYDENQQEKQLNLNELEHSILKTTIDSKDVIFSGVLRQPNQRLLRNINNTSNIKLENLNDPNNYSNNGINNYNDNKLCTICKLMKNTELTGPPNTSTNEINYLLHFTYNRIKTWIPEDTFSPLELPFGKNEKLKDDIDFCKRKLIKSLKTMADIKKNLKLNFYTKLEDFHTDILDIQHCLGILYGVKSQEYEAIKYLIKDCVYELSEIKQCRDCYRHSNEMSGQFWFSKPCVLRHELVFAKQIGYNYWPAKVIKFSQNQYDVRFFGQKHSRAVIDAQFVKPIDLDLKQLKIKKTAGFVKAMEELQKHQELLLLPSGTFSYDSSSCNSNVDFYNEVSNEFENEKHLNLCDKNLITSSNNLIMTANSNRKSKVKRNTKRTTLSRRKSPSKRKTLINNRADETSSLSPTISTTTTDNISRSINNNNNNNSNLKNNNYNNNNFNNITNNNNNSKKILNNVQQQYNNIMNEQITIIDDISLQSLNSSQNSSTIATVVNKRKRNENFSHLFVEDNSNADNSSGESTISDYIIRKNKNKKRILKRKTQSEGDTGGDHNSKRSKKLTKKDSVDKEGVNLDELHQENNKDAQQEQPFLNLMNNDKNNLIEKAIPLAMCAGTTSNSSTSGIARIKANIIDRKWDVVEGLSRNLSTIDNISEANKLSLDTLQEEIKRWQTKISLLKEEHKKAISLVKKQQWCHTCEELANYYCCWLASYCSVQCQKQEWNDHKLLCKNKSNINNKEENCKDENQNKKDDNNTDLYEKYV